MCKYSQISPSLQTGTIRRRLLKEGNRTPLTNLKKLKTSAVKMEETKQTLPRVGSLPVKTLWELGNKNSPV